MRLALVTVLAVGASVGALAQTRAQPTERRPAAPAPTRAAPDMKCPAPLGSGVATKLSFCDVLSGRDPLEGVIITLPPHRGTVTLSFDLHNRHTYSEAEVRANRAYARYTAVIGVLAIDNTLISRAAIRSEFRNAPDLVDRIDGGAGPGGVKAVAPTGTEHIVITIPEQEQEVSLLGEKLTIERIDGAATYVAPGRPVAVISNVMIEYYPGPPPRKPTAKPPPKAAPRKPGT
jgi:hypothetical protein